ncbi:hypothetical protein E1283_26310 [Streptomyces hainanensis]|uniref:Rhamnogalacturonan lyase family 11 C-terminal domain-containing protein n=1 Tax=Streptomyces hainanensis TaxID=402648 RepID=A0A4V2Y1L6_9ACTN|nr:hypothetical protein E1283_26310 [Streptomyces hainanensis]
MAVLGCVAAACIPLPESVVGVHGCGVQDWAAEGPYESRPLWAGRNAAGRVHPIAVVAVHAQLRGRSRCPVRPVRTPRPAADRARLRGLPLSGIAPGGRFAQHPQWCETTPRVAGDSYAGNPGAEFWSVYDTALRDLGGGNIGREPSSVNFLAWQNTAYNQPPHPGFYLGYGMDPAPRPASTDR